MLKSCCWQCWRPVLISIQQVMTLASINQSRIVLAVGSEESLIKKKDHVQLRAYRPCDIKILAEQLEVHRNMQNSQIFLKDKTNVGTIICWNFSFCRIVHKNSMSKMCISKYFGFNKHTRPVGQISLLLHSKRISMGKAIIIQTAWSKTPEVTT